MVNNLNIILCLCRLSVIQITVVSGAWKESNLTLKFSEDVFGIEVASWMEVKFFHKTKSFPSKLLRLPEQIV